MDKPTLDVPEGFEDYDHEVRAVLLARNEQADLRDAVDAILSVTTECNPSTVNKEWMARVFLALGGTTNPAVDLEVDNVR